MSSKDLSALASVFSSPGIGIHSVLYYFIQAVNSIKNLYKLFFIGYNTIKVLLFGSVQQFFTITVKQVKCCQTAMRTKVPALKSHIAIKNGSKDLLTPTSLEYVRRKQT